MNLTDLGNCKPKCCYNYGIYTGKPGYLSRAFSLFEKGGNCGYVIDFLGFVWYNCSMQSSELTGNEAVF